MYKRRYLFSQLACKEGDNVHITRALGPKGYGEIDVRWLRGNQSLLTVIQSLVEAEPNGYFYVILGYKSKHFEFEPGLYEDAKIKRLAWILIPALSNEFDVNLLCSLWDKRLVSYFGDVQGKNALSIPIDAIIGFSPMHAQDLSFMCSQSIRVIPGIVRHDTGVDNGGVQEEWGRPGKNTWKMETILAVNLGTWHVFLSKGQMDTYVKVLLKPIVTPSFMRRWIDRCTVKQNGFSSDQIDEIIGTLDYDRDNSVGSFYRISTEKGTEEAFQLMERIWRLGKVDRLVVTTQTEYDKNEVFSCDVPALDFTSSCQRDDFLKKAAETKVAFFNSKAESAPTAPVEAALCGCVPLLPACQWVRDTFGKYGWKYVYKSQTEAINMALHVLQNYETEGPYARAFALEHYSAAVKGKEFMDYVNEVADSCNMIDMMNDELFTKYCKDSKIIESLKFIEDRDVVSIHEVNNKIYMPRNRIGRPVVMTKYEVPMLLHRLHGLEDNLKTPIPEYERSTK